MKYLTSGLMAVTLMFGLLSCINSNNTSNTAEATPGDTTIEKIIIVDVRTVEEWVNDGHADCSVNYPLNELGKKAETLKAYDKVVLVCRTGSRAGTAKGLIEQAGIKNVENKGAWQHIKCR